MKFKLSYEAYRALDNINAACLPNLLFLLLFLLLYNRLYFLEHFQVHGKIEEKVQKLLIYFLLLQGAQSLIEEIPKPMVIIQLEDRQGEENPS